MKNQTLNILEKEFIRELKGTTTHRKSAFVYIFLPNKKEYTARYVMLIRLARKGILIIKSKKRNVAEYKLAK